MNQSKLFKYFSRKEMACRCCGRLPTEDGVMSTLEYAEFGMQLDKLREVLGKPIIIGSANSAYRCAKHNKEVGGATNSTHMKGIAVDIAVPSLEYRKELLAAAEKAGGWNGVGIADTFVHLDRRTVKASWTY